MSGAALARVRRVLDRAEAGWPAAYATAAERLDEAPELIATFRVTAQQHLQTASRIERGAGLDAC